MSIPKGHFDLMRSNNYLGCTVEHSSICGCPQCTVTRIEINNEVSPIYEQFQSGVYNKYQITNKITPGKNFEFEFCSGNIFKF